MPMLLFASLSPLHIVGILSALIFAYVFLVPLLTLATFKHEANPVIQLLDSSIPLPPEVNRYFVRIGEELARLGFEERATVLFPHPTNNVRMIVRLIVNQSNRDCAVVVSVMVGTESEWKIQSQFVEINSRFQNGTEINTGNPDDVSAFRSPPNTLTTHAPWLKTMDQLYRAHLAIVNLRAGKETKVLSLATQFHGDAPAYLADAIHHELANEQAIGRLVLADQYRSYRTTVKGAYIYTWKNIPPMKQIYQVFRNAKSRNTLSQAGF